MNDFDAAKWLDRALKDAESEVGEIQVLLKGKRFLIQDTEGDLEQAVAKVDAIRLIISRSGLEGSAPPADSKATGNRKKGNVAQTDHD